MADDNSPRRLEFVQFHLPSLTAGDYSIEIEQTIESAHSKKLRTGNRFFGRLDVTVGGERILLKPADIDAVFPPEGSLLDHSNILPHISLKRSTLPWERNADENDPESPFLALLVFDEAEPVQRKNIKLRELQTTLPGFSIAPGEDPDDSAMVIDLPLSLLSKVLPSVEELKLLTHVRRSPAGDETAVVIANRVPAQGVTSTAYLVSLEGGYKNSGAGKPTFQGKTSIRLVCLKHWRFSCLRRYLLTPEVLSKLEDSVPDTDFQGLKQLQDVEITGRTAFLEAVKQQLGRDVPSSYRDALLKIAEWKKTFREVLLQLDHGVFRLPPKGVAESTLASGFVPLPHQFRNGEALVSWYRGPLLPGSGSSRDWPGPVRSADALGFVRKP